PRRGRSFQRCGSSGCRREGRPSLPGRCLPAAFRQARSERDCCHLFLFLMPCPSLGHHTEVLEAIDGIVLPFIDALYSQLGYVGVAIAMTIQRAAAPLPSELILPFAGWSVSRGLIEPLTNSPWSYWGAVVAGVFGNTAGSLLSYAIGAYGGRPLVERFGKYVLISAHDLDVAERWFDRYGEATVFFSRMLPIVRTFFSIPLGVAR